MAGHARYTALLDACVLYPMVVADSLMSLATTGLFAAKWSTRIEDEWIAALEERRPDLQGKLGYRRAEMRRAVPDWEGPARAWQPLTPGLLLPDANDVHVLAAAIAGHADCIVTVNLKDFPSDVLDLYAIEAIDPDQFVVNQWDLDEAQTIKAFKRMRARWKKPAATVLDFAAALERGGLVMTSARLRESADHL